MPIEQQDVIVLGAGIVGVSTALHLQARGRSVALVDKGEPGTERVMETPGLSNVRVSFHILFRKASGRLCATDESSLRRSL
ncbi:FAD-binding oxidoreductase [Ochrobactrum daejeonense]|nr:FAD-binding oxidoreductase [Brucella daejeonensis]